MTSSPAKSSSQVATNSTATTSRQDEGGHGRLLRRGVDPCCGVVGVIAHRRSVTTRSTPRAKPTAALAVSSSAWSSGMPASAGSTRLEQDDPAAGRDQQESERPRARVLRSLHGVAPSRPSSRRCPHRACHQRNRRRHRRHRRRHGSAVGAGGGPRGKSYRRWGSIWYRAGGQQRGRVRGLQASRHRGPRMKTPRPPAAPPAIGCAGVVLVGAWGGGVSVGVGAAASAPVCSWSWAWGMGQSSWE